MHSAFRLTEGATEYARTVAESSRSTDWIEEQCDLQNVLMLEVLSYLEPK